MALSDAQIEEMVLFILDSGPVRTRAVGESLREVCDITVRESSQTLHKMLKAGKIVAKGEDLDLPGNDDDDDDEDDDDDDE